MSKEMAVNMFRNRAKTMTPSCLLRRPYSIKRTRRKKKNVRESRENKKLKKPKP